MEASSELPPLERILLNIRYFPLDFWHPYYFRQATTSMGRLAGFSQPRESMPNRYTLRILIECQDRKLIPYKLMVGHNDRCTQSTVEIDDRQPWSDDHPAPPTPPPPELGSQERRRQVTILTNSQVRMLTFQPDWMRMGLKLPLPDRGRRAAPAALGSLQPMPWSTILRNTPNVANPDTSKKNSDRIAGNLPPKNGTTKQMPRTQYLPQKNVHIQRYTGKIPMLPVYCTNIPLNKQRITISPKQNPPDKSNIIKSQTHTCPPINPHNPNYLHITPKPKTGNASSSKPQAQHLNRGKPYLNSSSRTSLHTPTQPKNTIMATPTEEDKAFIMRFVGLTTKE